MGISSSLHLKRHETRIQDLPEDIILCLMASLKLRDVVNFSLVSKQWIHLPSCLERIELDEGMFKEDAIQHCPENKDAFVIRVNQFLNHYAKLRSMVAQPVSLRKFVIRFCLDRESCIDVDGWISMAITNGVSTLIVTPYCDFHLTNKSFKPQSHDEKYVFPWLKVGNPPTALKILVLRSGVFGCYLATEWPSLEILELTDMVLTQHDMDRRINRCFPCLQRIVLKYCKVPDKLMFAVGPLTCLKVVYCREVKEIKVLDASKLREFAFKGRGSSLDLNNAHQVTNVTFGACRATGMDYIFQKLHRNLPAMQSLSVCIYCDSLPSPSQICGGMSSFLQLEELKIYSHPSCGFSLQTIEEVLKACPVLRRLEMVPPCTADIGSVIASPVQYRHKCLKFIKLLGFCGSFANVELAKFLVQVSESLCQIAIEKNVEDTEYTLFQHSSGWHGQQEYKVEQGLCLNLERDFLLVIEPMFLDKFPNITRRLARPAVALVSTNSPSGSLF